MGDAGSAGPFPRIHRAWHLWIGRARHPGPGSAPFLIEVLNVGSGLRIVILRWMLRLIF